MFLLLSSQTVLGAKKRLNMASHSWHWTSNGTSAVSNARPVASSSLGSTLASECFFLSSSGLPGLLHPTKPVPLSSPESPESSIHHIHLKPQKPQWPPSQPLPTFRPSQVVPSPMIHWWSSPVAPSFLSICLQLRGSQLHDIIPTSIPPSLPSDCFVSYTGSHHL